MRPPALAIVLALLVALAGCSLVGDPATPEPTTTTPTATTPTPAEGIPPDVRPPGVNATTLVAPAMLLEAHTERLVADGFAREIRVEGTARREVNGAVRLVNVSRQSAVSVEADAVEYRRVLVNAGTGARFDAWGNRTTEIVRVTIGNATRYQVGQSAGRGDLTGAAFLAPYLRASSFSVAGVGRTDNRTLVRFVGRLAPGADPASVFPPGASNVSGYRAELLVDTDGRIHRLHVTGSYDVGGERAIFEVRYELTAVGGIAVTRPEWLEALGNATAD